MVSAPVESEYVVRAGLNRRGVPNTPPVQKLSKLVVPLNSPPLVLRRGLKERELLGISYNEPGQVNRQYCNSEVTNPSARDPLVPPT